MMIMMMLMRMMIIWNSYLYVDWHWSVNAGQDKPVHSFYLQLCQQKILKPSYMKALNIRNHLFGPECSLSAPTGALYAILCYYRQQPTV